MVQEKPTGPATTEPAELADPATEPEVGKKPAKATKAKTKRKIFLLKFRGESLHKIKSEEKIQMSKYLIMIIFSKRFI